MINDPEVLFLDEPTVGLDPDVSNVIREEIRSIQRERNMTILLTTHNMKEAELLCHRIAFLKAGEILATGTPEELKRSVRIGDLVRVEYSGKVSEDGLLQVEGVINFTVADGFCEVIVDDAERRLGSLIALLSQGGAHIKRVKLGQTDLEDVFLEFARSEDNP
jgi:ABC-2 type transport system ATP-binding protein